MNKLFLAIAFLGLTLTACHKHDDTTLYIINFDVKNATGGTDLTTAVNKEITFDVTFTHASKSTIHNVKVAVLDATGKEIKVLEEKHAHVAGTYNTKLKYTPTAAGSYKLKTSATDDSEKQPNEKMFDFKVN